MNIDLSKIATALGLTEDQLAAFLNEGIAKHSTEIRGFVLGILNRGKAKRTPVKQSSKATKEFFLGLTESHAQGLRETINSLEFVLQERERLTKKQKRRSSRKPAAQRIPE